jgi:predicted RNA binding protein YcfA (HicA-like mRNA interferase family)
MFTIGRLKACRAKSSDKRRTIPLSGQTTTSFCFTTSISLPATQGQRYPYEMSEALPVLHLEVSHDLSALIYDRPSNGCKYSVAHSYCQGGFPNASKVSMLEAMPVLWLFRF